MQLYQISYKHSRSVIKRTFTKQAMEKYFLSSRKLFHTLLATVLLLLIYAQSLHSKDLRPVKILEETEVTTLNNVVSELKQRPAPIFNEYVCRDQSAGIKCNCNSNTHPPERKCEPDQIGRVKCRIHITCHVCSIVLSGLHLNGKIPSSIQDLTYLQKLDLSSNQLRGPIPKELSRLRKLDTLILFKNYLDGSIPKELCTLPALQYLDLGANLLSGEIPKELGNIRTLRYLILTSNRLEGKLPAQLGYLKYLRTLALADNAFNETLPPELKSLTQMHEFDVMGNNFSGPLPQYIWPKLQKYKFLGNNFEGPIPNQISYSTYLVTLMISDLNYNKRGFPFPDLSKLKSLKNVTFRNCSIVGGIHESIGTLSSLKNIDLSFNRLSDKLPVNMNQLSLDSLYLTENKFTGPIPIWVKNIKNADFSHNSFSEVKFKYSKEMSRRLNLYACCDPPENGALDIEWEKSTFSCPANKKPKNTQLFINSGGDMALYHDKSYEADLSPDGASTFYMSDTWGYSSAGRFLGSGGDAGDYTSGGDDGRGYVQNTSCLDTENSPLSTTARISPMSLKYYGFCLKEDHYTVKLYFNEIVFTNASDYGVNAKRVFNVFIQGKPVLTDFNIQKKALGSRKEVVENFTAHVKKNQVLEIHFYWAGKGSVYIPPGLYGPLVSAISVTPVQRPPKKSGPPKKLLLTAGQIVGIAGSTFFVMVLILAFLHKMGWLGKILSNPDSSISSKGVGPYNFQQLKVATGGFSPNNKIGKGGSGRVYKGVVRTTNGEEIEIAVKKLSSDSKEVKENFRNEVRQVASLDHPNLVKLLGCCTENKELLLVYEYMKNNSLSNALFGSPELKSRLNWETRLQICLGIAKGLAYLHEEALFKIIHRDIKPNNVLLDENLNAKISEFGLAVDHEQGAGDTVVGGTGSRTSCYVAPEYAMYDRLSSKADVYSFGMVMLEILSGISSTSRQSDDESVYLLDRANVKYQEGTLSELLDPDLKKDLKEDELYEVKKQAKRLFILAMQCSQSTSIVRPKMSEVVSILEGKTEPKSILVVAPNYSDDGSTSRDGTSDPFFSLDSMPHGETYNFQQLKDATTNFNPANEIGQGSYGRVYKGELPSGLVIAVKLPVPNSKKGKQAFINEVAIINGLDHPNLVKLLGCCFEDNQLLLVYEYMENNSLFTALFGGGNSNLKVRLNWQARLKICLGIAKGLAYLHDESNESKLKIIHRNIKPTNILLDKDLNAKLSGFGLAKHHEEKHALGTKVGGTSGTKVGGTSCYVAPEYAMRDLLAYKVDVFSFGIVMLEILSGKAGVHYKPNDETEYLLDQACLLHQNDNLILLMDPDLVKYEKNQANMMLNLAMLCINQSPGVRPKMSEVVSILEGKTELNLKSVPIVAIPSNSDDGSRK